MRESPKEYLLSSKARYQNSQDIEDAADVFFAIRNMLNHGLEVDWDDVILKKVLEEVGETKDSIGPAVEPKGKSKPRQKLKIGETPIAEIERNVVREKPDDFDEEKDKFRTDQGQITGPHKAWKTTSGNEEGAVSEAEVYQYVKWGLPGARQRGKGAVGGTGEEWEIPSRHHDNVPVLVPLTLDQIDPDILRYNTIEDLVKKHDKVVPGQEGITYGHYLQMLVSRPKYGVNEGPLHSLQTFSDSKGGPSLYNTANHLSHERLDPDSDDYLKKVCDARHAENQRVMEECAKFPNEERIGKEYQKTHLHDRRAKTLEGKIPGKMEGLDLDGIRVLPNSHVPWEIHQSSFREWLKRMREFNVFGPGLQNNESELRKLYRDWFDLVHMDGLQETGGKQDKGLSEGEQFILSHLLDDSGNRKKNEDGRSGYSRLKIIHSPTYRRLRKNSNTRVGFLPYMLGLQNMSPADRRLALANFFSHIKEDSESSLNKGDQYLEQTRGFSEHKQREDDVMDHMIASLQRNITTWGKSWTGSSFGITGANPTRGVYRQSSDDMAEDIRKALSGLHLMPTLTPKDERFDPKVFDEGEGWDDPKKRPSQQKSALDYLRAAKIEIKDGIPVDWDLDNDPLKEFNDKFVKFLPQEYQKSGMRRFDLWWTSPPDAMLRSQSTTNQKHSSHERDAVKPVTLSEDGDHTNTPAHLEKTPMYQENRVTPKVGGNLRDADIYDILVQAFPFLGVEKKYSDIVLEFGYNTLPPDHNLQPEAYDEWLEDYGGMSGLGNELDDFLRHGHEGPRFKKMWNKFYGPLEELTGGTFSADPKSNKRVMYLLNAILAEKLSDPSSAREQGKKPGSYSMDLTSDDPNDSNAPFAGQRSVYHEARTKDPKGRVLGYRPPNSTITRILSTILQPGPAFLPSAVSMGIRSKLQELGAKIYDALAKKGQAPREEDQQRIFKLHDELRKMGVNLNSIDDIAFIARNSALTGAANHHQPNHSETSVYPKQTQENTEIRMSNPGKQAAIAGGSDGLRNAHLQAGSHCINGTSGEKTQSQKGIETGRALLWYAKMFGIGGSPATYTDEDGEEHLALEKIMEWGESHMKREGKNLKGSRNFAAWLNSQSHPWARGETMGGYTGVGKQESWREHPKMEEDRYLYPVDEAVDDRGETVYRMPMQGAVPVLQGHQKVSEDLFATPMHRQREFNPAYNPLRVSNLGFMPNKDEDTEREMYDLFHTGTIPERYLHTDEKGKKYMVGEHPAKFLDSWANVLKERDPEINVDAIKDEAMERFLEKNEPHSLTKDEHKEWFGPPEIERKGEASFRKREYEARVHALYFHAAKAAMPIVKRLFAQAAMGRGGEDALEEYMNKYIRQDPNDSPYDKQQKYLNFCYLFEKSAEWADKAHISSREVILNQLKDSGFEFSDEEESRFIDDKTDNSPHRHLGIPTSSVRFAHRNYSYPEDMGENEAFLAAFRRGATKDVDGFHLLGKYIDDMYEHDEDTAGHLREKLGEYYDLYGQRDSSGSPKKDKEVNIGGKLISFTDESLYDQDGKPNKDLQRELDKVGGKVTRLNVGFHNNSLNQNRQDVVDVKHHQAGLPEDSPFPKHLSNLDEREGAGMANSSAHRDIMGRGMRARNSKRLWEYLENVMRDDHDTREFFELMSPVMDGLVNDLQQDGRLPEHTPHQPVDFGDISSVMKEFSRLLYLRGVFDRGKRGIPKPEVGQYLGHIGDNSPIDPEDGKTKTVNADRLNLITSSGLTHNMLHTLRGTPSHMMEIGHGMSQERGHHSRPGVIATSNFVEKAPFDDVSLIEHPVTTFHPDVLNAALGEPNACTERQVDELGGYGEARGGDFVAGFMSLDVLTDVDLLLKEEDRDKGKPVPVKAMHRIFSIEDLEFLRGFSDDWVVSSWPSGTRLIVDKKGKKVKARNSDGKAVPLPNEVKRGVKEAHDKDFTVDAIWDEERLHMLDLLECGDNDLADNPTKDRSRHLRAHFDSTEKVVTPAPVNTKRVDGEGLARAVKDLMKEPDVKQVLLRDAESTYMRGETRHPKWVMLNPDHLVDVLVLSSSSDDTHLIGVGPLYEEDARAIGNRAVRYDGDYYMDVGTVSRSGLEEGMYITVKTSGVSHSKRRKYSVYRLNAPRYMKESESGATDSIETLDILRNRQEGNIPHKVRIKKGKIHIEVPTGHVVYETESHGNAFILKDVDSPDDYTLRVVESQREYWSPIAAVLLRSEKESKGKERIEEEPPANHDKKPKKVLPKRDELLKDPEVVKTMVLALETVENMLKEKVTMTGPKALGIDYATPVESPRGPTKVTEPYDLPDHDPAARQKEPKACWCGAEEGEECAQGMGHNMENCPQAHPPKKEKKVKHLKISQDSHDDSPV